MYKTKLENIASLDYSAYSSTTNTILLRVSKLLFIIGVVLIITLQNKAYSNTDSLHSIFYTDTLLSVNEKIKLADSLSALYAKTDLNKAIECEKAIYHFSKINNDKDGMIASLKSISTKQNRICNYESADTSLHTLLLLLINTVDTNEMGEAFYNLASNYYDWSDYKNANDFFIKAQKHFKRNGDKQGIAKSMKGEAVVVSTWGDYEKAIGLMQNARDIYEDIQDELGLAGMHLSLGVVMQEWNKLDRSLDYYNQAFRYYHNNDLKINEVNILLHIGDIYLLKEHYYFAIETYRQAQQLELQVVHKKLRSIVLSNIGEAYYHLNLLDSALYYQTKSLILKNEVGDNKRTAISYFVIGNIHSKLNQNDSSIHYLKTSLLLARSIGLRDTEINALKALSEIYSSIEQFDIAYVYLLEHMQLKELTFNDKTNIIIEELAIKYEAEKKQTENELLKQNNSIQQLQLDKERNSNLFTIIFASFIVLTAFIIVFFVNSRTNESRKNFSLLTYKNKEITRQKEELGKLNQDLEESRERFRGIIDNATIGIYQTDPEGEILFANKNLIKTLEFDSFETLKQINLNTQYPNRGEFLKEITKNKIITGREDIWKKADGTTIYVMESAWSVKNNDGSIKYIEGLIEDITKRKEVELALEESKEKLKKTNETLLRKNEQVELSRIEAEEANQAKSTFLANVSHEIRTPMNSIIGFTELLLSTETEPKKQSYLSAIDSSSKSLLALINDILDLSKIRAEKLKLNFNPVSLRIMLNEIEQIFSLQVKRKKIKFINNFDSKLPEFINIDRERLKQILLNIIGNAIKFTDKGFVEVTTNFNFVNKSNNKINIEIIVTDSGPGISENDQLHIFNAFNQSENIITNRHIGTGLGLSIAKQLIELMHGKLELQSSLGKGSAFTISIPNILVKEIRNHIFEGEETQTVIIEKSIAIIQQEQDYFNLNTISNQHKNELNEQFGLMYSEISTNKIIANILEFSISIEKFAVSKNINELQLLSVKLKQACAKFDVENIESILILLKPVFNGK